MFQLNKFRFCLLLALSSLFVISYGYSKSEYLVEESRRLEEFAKALKATLNETVDPCEHFLEYVNGSKPEEILFPNMDGIVEDDLHYIIPENSSLSKQEQMIRDFYLSCKSSPNDFLDAIKDVDITNEIISFPIVDKNWSNTNQTLALFEAKLNPYGASIFLSGKAIRAKSGDYKFNIELKHNSFNGSTKALDILRIYKRVSKYTFDSFYDEITQFEDYYHLVRNRYPEDYRKLPTKITIGELKEKYPNFDWEQYFSIIAGGVPVSDSSEVSIKDEDKLSHFYNDYPSAVNRTVALYYLLQLHANLENVHRYSKYRCLDESIKTLRSIVTNIILQNFVNSHDAINFIDTATAILQTHEEPKYNFLRLPLVNELLSKKEEYADYVKDTFEGISIHDNKFLLNYVRIMTANNAKAIPEEFTVDLSRFLHTLKYSHLKPRLVLSAMLALWYPERNFTDVLHEWAYGPIECPYLETANIKTVLDRITSLEQLDNEKYQNELNTLTKFGLTPRKALLLILGQESLLPPDHPYGYLAGLKMYVTTKTMKTVKTFTIEFNCPIDSETSELFNKCKLL